MNNSLRLFVVLVICTVAANGRPAKDEIPQGRPQTQDTAKAKGYEYLAKYGYLDKNVNKDDTGEGIPAKTIEKAIKKLQTFAGLSPTGTIDESTLELIEKPRCGVNDPEITNDIAGANALMNGTVRTRRYIVAGPPYEWDKNDLTYKITNYPGLPSTITSEQVDDDVRRAFRLWSDVTPLTFRSVESEDEADIRLTFGKRAHTELEDDPPFDGPGGTLAHAFSPNSNWGATDGDAHFDEDEMYTHGVAQPQGVNFFYTVAHEIGHTLGLDHSDVPQSLMWPWAGRTFNPDFVLPQDDKDAIQSIYGANPNPPTSPPTLPPPVPAYCTASFSSIVPIRGQLYAFSNDKLWRFDLDGNLLSDSDGEFSRTYFPKLPRHSSAGYERWFDGKIYFFKGRKYWIYKSARPSPPLFKMYDINTTNPVDEPDFPRPVTELSIPKKITAALHVADMGRTYLFKAKNVMILDEFEGTFADPLKTRRAFPGAPWSPTGAFYNDGYAYLLYSNSQGADYYRFKWDQTGEAFVGLPGYPRGFYQDILDCP